MRGAVAKRLRTFARGFPGITIDRQLRIENLTPRTRWVDVPDDSGNFLTRLRNKFLHKLGMQVPMKRERQTYTPQRVVEAKHSLRWRYRWLKQRFRLVRRAA